MKKLNNKQMLIRKLVSLGCAVVCVLLMMVNFISYTSSSSLIGGGAVTWNNKVSLFNFLFNGDKVVMDAEVSVLRDVFGFAYVIMWISFILFVASIVLLTIGVFMKKTLISKLGSCILFGGLLLLCLISFDKYEFGNTIKYMDVFTLMYGVIVLVSVGGLVSSLTLDNK